MKYIGSGMTLAALVCMAASTGTGAAAPSADWDAWAKGVQAKLDGTVADVSKRQDDLEGRISAVEKQALNAQAPNGKSAGRKASGGDNIDARLASVERMVGIGGMEPETQVVQDDSAAEAKPE